jgi:hypothetical protein
LTVFFTIINSNKIFCVKPNIKLKEISMFSIKIIFSQASAANKYKSQFFLVFEFCEHDLAGLLTNPSVKFNLGEQKKIMQQLLNGKLVVLT